MYISRVYNLIDPQDDAASDVGLLLVRCDSLW